MSEHSADFPAVPTRTIADALAQRSSHQMEALETLVARVMDEVAAAADGLDLDGVQKLLADRLRAHVPVDSKANKAWLRERARLIMAG